MTSTEVTYDNKLNKPLKLGETGRLDFLQAHYNRHS